MDPEGKKKFNFGTGEIDTEKWLLGIDSGLEGYYKTYGDYWGKERTAEVQAAMQNLIGRISSGDMTSRGADGTYNFASQLYTPERNKYTKWAYRTALGYLSNVGRGLIASTETKNEELKNDSQKYSLQTLIQRLNNSIMRGATKLDLKNTWWNKATQQLRVDHLKDFFTKEALYLRNSQDELGPAYSDLTKDLLADMMKGLSSKLATTGDFTKEFNQLGIYNILNPTETEEPQPIKSVDELISEHLKSSLDKAKELYLQLLQSLGLEQYLNFNGPRYNKVTEALKTNLAYLSTLNNYGPANLGLTLNTSLFSKYNLRIAPNTRDVLNEHFVNTNNELTTFLLNLLKSWEDLFNGNSPYSEDLLSTLLAKYNYKDNVLVDGKDTLDYVYLSPNLKPISISNNLYYIPGTYRTNGSMLLLDSANNRLVRSHKNFYPNINIKELLDVDNKYINSQKEGGVIKFLNGGYKAPVLTLYNTRNKNSNPIQASNNISDIKFSLAENARIAATIADIASMGAAFVPGYGTATSAVLGLGSTVTNFGADLADGLGLLGAAKNAGFGLAADVMGLIPGLGGVGKGAKIARNLMWAVPKLIQWANTATGIYNINEIKDSVVKLTNPSSMSLLDWLNVSLALQIVTGHGRSVATRVKKEGMPKKVTTTDPEYYVFTNKGKQKVTAEQFKKIRETRGVANRLAVTEQELGEGTTLNQTRFVPWNTSTIFGAFKLVPGRTQIEIQGKHKGWFSDENLVQKVENFSPTADIRSVLSKINPYKTYYTNRSLVKSVEKLPPIIPEKNRSILEAYWNAATNPLDIRGPKQPYPWGPAPNRQKILKELENLRKTLKYGLLEEIPEASSRAMSLLRQLDIKTLRSRYANEVETPELRLGGIIKAQDGTKFNSASYNEWVKLQYNDPDNYQTTLKGYKDAGGSSRSTNGLPPKGLYVNNEGELDFMSAYLALLNYYNSDSGKNIFGDVLNYYNKYWLPDHQNGTIEDFIKEYNELVDWLRSQNIRKFGETAIANLDKSWGEYNEKFNKMYEHYSPYSENLKSILGESTWQRMPNAFANLNDREDLRSGYLIGNDENSRVAIDNKGHLIQNTTEDNTLSSADTLGSKSKEKDLLSGSKEKELQSNLPNPELKSPFDYRPILMGIRYTTTGLANSWLYDRIAERLPGPAYKDFIDRKLDTIGDYAFRVHKSNLGVDVSSLLKLRLVSDLSLNLAADNETGRIRRNLEDEGYLRDAEKLANTHLAGVQIDLKDLEDNREVAWYNRVARLLYLQQLSNIRNALDKANADNTIALANNLTGWANSLFLENKAKYEQARALMNPTPEERAQEIMKSDPLYLRLLNGDSTLTTEDKNLIRLNNLAALRQARIEYAMSTLGNSARFSKMKDDPTNTESKRSIKRDRRNPT